MRFVVLEAGPELGHVWRDRWDSLKLFTPAQYSSLPGQPFRAPVDTYPLAQVGRPTVARAPDRIDHGVGLLRVAIGGLRR